MKIKVPFIDLKRLESGFHGALMEKFHAMTLGAKFIGGAEVATFESRLQSGLQVAHAVSCANGTDALQLALRAVGAGEGDVVLVPNVTFWATFEAVVNVGAKPLTVDADRSDGGVCFESFARAILEFGLRQRWWRTCTAGVAPACSSCARCAVSTVWC